MNLRINVRTDGETSFYSTSHPHFGGTIQTIENNDGVFVWFGPTRMRPRVYLGRILVDRHAEESHKRIVTTLAQTPPPILRGIFSNCANRGRANKHLQRLV